MYMECATSWNSVDRLSPVFHVAYILSSFSLGQRLPLRGAIMDAVRASFRLLRDSHRPYYSLFSWALLDTVGGEVAIQGSILDGWATLIGRNETWCGVPILVLHCDTEKRWTCGLGY
jgi:hypothetical protein